MSKLIRLLPAQKKALKVASPFPLPPKMSKEETALRVEGLLAGNRALRDELILGNVYLILNIVGRYTCYWPQTKKLEEDMVSEGLLSLIKTIDEVESVEDQQWLAYRIVYKAKYAIEKFVNENISLVSASFTANRQLLADGKKIVRPATEEIKESHRYSTDDGPGYVDLADTLETFMQADKEELVDAVLWFLESDHNIKDSDLDSDQFGMLLDLIKVTKGEL